MNGLFGIGRYVDHGGRCWRIADIRREPTGMWAMLEIGDEFDRVKVSELVDELLGPVQDTEEGLSTTTQPDCPELAELSPAQQKSVLDRYAHLMEADGRSPWEGAHDARYDPALTLKERLRAKADELRANGDKHCSAETLRRQLKAAKEHGMVALIHGNARSVDQRLAGIDPDLLAVARRFGQQQQAQAKISQRRLLVKLRAELGDAGFDLSDIGSNRLKLILGHSSRGLGLHKDARSRRMHSTKPHTLYQGKVVSRPGEVVQIDATNTVVHAWDPYAGWVRAIVLTAIDVYSRAILALRVVSGSVTARDVGLLLWDMGRPTITRSRHTGDLWLGTPDEVYVREVVTPDRPAPADIVIGQKPAVHPATILMDHGSENESKALFSIASQVGISILFCAPRDPASKGTVESWHNSLREMQTLLPWGKGESANNHPADVESHALLTAADLEEFLWESIVERYHDSPHRGLRDASGREAGVSPRAAFDAYITAGGAIRVPDHPHRYIEFLPSQRCTVNDYGLNLGKRIYDSKELGAVRDQLQRGVGVPAEKLTVYHDPHASDIVFARHPITRSWMAIPRVQPGRGAAAPYSDLVTREVEKQYGKALTAQEQQRREVELVRRWREGDLVDIRDARLAAIERARAAGLAQDRADAPEVAQLIKDASSRHADQEMTYTSDVSDLDDDPATDWTELGEAAPW